MSIVTITSANFEKEVLKSETTVLLDFWASWCGPCQRVAPILEEVATERPDVKVGKVNVDDEGDLAMKFGITSIPTLIVIKNGTVTKQAVGLRPKADILGML